MDEDRIERTVAAIFLALGIVGFIIALIGFIKILRIGC